MAASGLSCGCQGGAGAQGDAVEKGVSASWGAAPARAGGRNRRVGLTAGEFQLC